MAPSVPIPDFDPVQGAALAHDLAVWYATHARMLPWRMPPDVWLAGARPDAYAVLMSEIALQQTTVAVGTVRVPELLARFPTLDALADAAEEEVLDAWAGLGYYARARNLHAAARVARERHGAIPLGEADLLALPGVGAYTAAAVAAIAGGQRAVVVDGNIERIMARVHAIDVPLPRARPIIYAAADAATPAHGAGNHAQALMDVAAAICRPKNPRCPECPIARHCRARAQGNPEAYPVRAAKAQKPHRVGMCAVAVDKHTGGVWMERRPAAGLLGGTLGFPGGEWAVHAEPDRLFPTEADWKMCGTVRHVFAHFSLDLEVWVAAVDSAQMASNRLFMTPAPEMEKARFSSLFAKAWVLAQPSVESLLSESASNAGRLPPYLSH